MIVFVPAYDDATRANLAVISKMSLVGCQILLSTDATRVELLSRLALADTAVFAMTHGKPHRLADHNQEDALGSSDIPHIGVRSLFVFACWTAGELGAAAARKGATWWGYTGPIAPPAPDGHYLDWFVHVFGLIRERFAVAFTADDRFRLMSEIADLCKRYTSMLDEEGEHASLDAYLSLLHIWQRLRVWVPGADEPEQHPEAPPPSILDESPSHGYQQRRYLFSTIHSPLGG